MSNTPNPSAESFYPSLATGYLRADIDMLRDWGVVVESADRAMIPAALRPAVVETINSPLAPFRISLKAGAVPLTDPVFEFEH
jgi:hypothetical protein